MNLAMTTFSCLCMIIIVIIVITPVGIYCSAAMIASYTRKCNGMYRRVYLGRSVTKVELM